MEQVSLNTLLLYKDEFIFLMVFSMLGVFIHESTTRKVRLFPFLFTFDNYMVAFVVSIICFGIDPYISQISDRIIIVIPIILGMIGKEVLSRLLTLQGSTSLLEYVLGFFGIINEAEKDNLGIDPSSNEECPVCHQNHHEHDNEKSSSPKQEEKEEKTTLQVSKPVAQEPIAQENINAVLEPPPIVTSVSQYENYKDLDNMVHSSLDSICNLVVDYYARNDVEAFLRGYHTLNVSMEILNHKLAQKQTVPVPTVLKLFEIGKKQTEIDLIYNQIINDIRKEKE